METATLTATPTGQFASSQSRTRLNGPSTSRAIARRLMPIDGIIGAGDLRPEYLDFLIDGLQRAAAVCPRQPRSWRRLGRPDRPRARSNGRADATDLNGAAHRRSFVAMRQASAGGPRREPRVAPGHALDGQPARASARRDRQPRATGRTWRHARRPLSQGIRRLSLAVRQDEAAPVDPRAHVIGGYRRLVARPRPDQGDQRHWRRAHRDRARYRPRPTSSFATAGGGHTG